MEYFILIVAIFSIVVYVLRYLDKIFNPDYKKREESPVPEPPGPRPLSREELEAIRQAERFFDDERVRQIYDRTYDGPLPEHTVGNFFTSIYPAGRDYDISGINYRRGIRNYVGRLRGAVVPEPKNEYDPNAIKIVAEDGHHLGYISKDLTDSVRAYTGNNFPYYCTIQIGEGEDLADDNRRYFYGWIILDKNKNV